MPAALSSDPDLIRKSYEDLVGEIFDAYWNDCFIGNPSSSDIQQGEAKFQKGITNARQARDRAIALLPP